MTIHLHEGDLPEGFGLPASVAIDTETMGLKPRRDRLCLVQLSVGDGDAHLVRIARGQTTAPRLAALLSSPDVLKIFHFARFDLAVLHERLGIDCRPVYCTKIASKLIRTYTDRHGLRDLLRETIGAEISKQQQSSDWGADTLTPEQQTYAAGDVLHLHAVKRVLDDMLAREGRTGLAQACFDFLPARARLDLMGWDEPDIFSH
ncbi:3'-5' exonuclease [Tistrella bauzanensis]|uniref:3'-5' exonuclease n=1 Tax=Tistrella bauzanensis TaxID=657419 RepID=A0ABQ1ICW3_9PROT|nr:ribonuclease H-like domain-containing protein [Tistrella bauzanensis]GGB35223.1 3'-5' exonuclease [Tistrella bauzanensis]